MNKTTSLSSSSVLQATSGGQFRHTNLWNNIISNLKQSLVEHEMSQNRKQHSRFVPTGFGGMLLIRHSFLNTTTTSGENEIYFTGSQCVDIVYDYLTSKENTHSFERQVTREKVSKLSQLVMDSGVFEPVNQKSARFEDSSLKLYRLKQTETVKNSNLTTTGSEMKKNDAKIKDEISTKKDEQNENEENNSKNANFNKCTKATFSSNSKIKRKAATMKRSSTIHTFLPIEEESCTGIKGSSKTTNEKIKPVEGGDEARKGYHSLTHNASCSNIGLSGDRLIKETPKLGPVKTAQEMLLVKQITRELVIEKLLSIIDLPVIENFIVVDERSDIEYRDLLERELSPQADENHNTVPLVPSRNVRLRSLSILAQSFDASKSDQNEEWRKSALDCLEFLEWERVWLSQQKEKCTISDKSLQLVLMKDLELYNLIRDCYTPQRRLHFLDDSFQPLFANILVFLRSSSYCKALDALNLGTLLLLKQTQAELKRLLKFLYLTANSTQAPRLVDNKPNNSILLNHFASSLFNTKSLGFEESRLILNFMLNNFDHLFRMSKSLEESINRRRLLMQKYGYEEALLENLYCKRMSSKEFAESSKEQTTKALVDLINHMIDDPQISLKQKKLKLKALQRIHPEVYEKHFSDLF